jgi:tight adherence protein C
MSQVAPSVSGNTAPRLELPDRQPFLGTRAADYVLGPVTPILASLLPESGARRGDIRRELQSAGYYSPCAEQNLAAVRYLCIVVPAVLLGLALLFVPPALERAILIAMLAVPALCWSVPRLVLRKQAARRRAQLERGLPDMLDMLTMCISQGMTLPRALERVSSELAEPHPALHQELAIVTDQASIGSLRQALENLARRVDVSQIQSFVSLLIQTETLGTPVAAALMEYSDVVRENLKQRADERGNRAAFRLLFPTVLCLMPAVYLILLGPAIIELGDFLKRDDRTLERANEIIRQTGRRAAPPEGRP